MPSDLDGYVAEDPDGPVVMLNLLRFRPDGGAEKYLAYAQQFESAGINAKYGVELVYVGQGGARVGRRARPGLGHGGAGPLPE